MIPASQIRARMQRGGHGCSAEGTWVERTMEPAGPADGNKKIKSLRDLIFFVCIICCLNLVRRYLTFVATALSNVRRDGVI